MRRNPLQQRAYISGLEAAKRLMTTGDNECIACGISLSVVKEKIRKEKNSLKLMTQPRVSK